MAVVETINIKCHNSTSVLNNEDWQKIKQFPLEKVNDKLTSTPFKRSSTTAENHSDQSYYLKHNV